MVEQNVSLAVNTQQIESNLAQLMKRSQALVVRDQNTFVEARTIQKDLDAYIKSVGFELDEGIAKAKGTLDHLKDQKEKFVAPARAQKDAIRQKADDWSAEEKRKAAAEAERINAENRRLAAIKAEEEKKAAEARAEEERKARAKEIEAARKAGDVGKREAERLKKESEAEAQRQREQAARDAELAKSQVQEVRVAPAIPKVAGVKDQTYYFAEITNPSAILFAYDKAIREGDNERAAFLSRFVMVDEKEVGAFARQTKNNEKAAAQVPGVRFWSKG
jgi:hypothetical protein